MAKGKSLCDLNEGQSAVVAGIINKGAMRRRLFDLGVVAGTKISCRQKSPSGDPAAYEIRGAVIALRTEDSSGILVWECAKE
ncbi:FeoA family protein [Diplocloster agilis]|uniref:Ferrous iron transport protein A n=1 Tax=Diplocloster agilis TaxID=2850323 RepID=A0A949JXS5_9FIRM|nr:MULTISPECIES: FeoA family protein [Lachnospiraceae]MBU9736044.1 ferrous iron transport protein A [Diplocloster agilis]MBU9744073.1 ferrous iron transport protein A [Diplocloster agilis]MCU6736405.1 ferrous iron transport protein A [Suonthocola fibrivorans]SCJ90189.1 FeoA domain [uncultured Clostridium sp.]